MDKNLPANAGDVGSIPGLRRFHTLWAAKAHEPQQLKPVCLQTVLHNKRSHRNEKPVHHIKGGPRAPQLQKTHAAAKTQHKQTNQQEVTFFIKKKNDYVTQQFHSQVFKN